MEFVGICSSDNFGLFGFMLKGGKMSDYRKVFDTLVGILIKAGYTDLIGKSLSHEDVLTALSDYTEKRDEMLEHILIELKE